MYIHTLLLGLGNLQQLRAQHGDVARGELHAADADVDPDARVLGDPRGICPTMLQMVMFMLYVISCRYVFCSMLFCSIE